MATAYDYITINGTQFPRPVNFTPQREDLFAGEYQTYSGKIVADRIGWKFSDIQLKWDALPQSLVQKLIQISGTTTIRFDDAAGFHNETVRRDSVVGMRHRYQINGEWYWKDVSVSFTFTGAHK